jgi:hypothetical protein
MIFFVGMMALLAGCGGSGTASVDAGSSATALRGVPTRLVLGGKTLLGDIFVWRDLMPVVGEGTRGGVITTFTLKADDGSSLPPSTTILKVQLVSGETVWTAPALEFPDKDSGKRVTVRNGPVWTVGSSVDVVVDFTENTGNVHQLRSAGNVVVGAY